MNRYVRPAILAVGAIAIAVTMASYRLSSFDPGSPSLDTLTTQPPSCAAPYPLSGRTSMVCVDETAGWETNQATAVSSALGTANSWGARTDGTGVVLGGLRATDLPCLKAYVLAEALDVGDQARDSYTMKDASGAQMILTSRVVNKQPERWRVGSGLFQVFHAQQKTQSAYTGYVGVRPNGRALVTVGRSDVVVLVDETGCEGSPVKRRTAVHDLLRSIQVRDTGCIDASVFSSADDVKDNRSMQVCVPRVSGIRFAIGDTTPPPLEPGDVGTTIWFGSGDPNLDANNPAAFLYVRPLDESTLPGATELTADETSTHGAYEWACEGECAKGHFYAKRVDLTSSGKKADKSQNAMVVTVLCNAVSQRSGVCADDFAKMVKEARVLG